MNWDGIHRWSIAISNIGLLAGLVLVAVQIQQNTAITRAQLMNDYFLADMELELAMMGDDPAASFTRAVFDPDALTEYDATVLDRYFNYGMVQLNRLRKMAELGLADEDWEERIGYLEWHLGNEAGRRWWREAKNDWAGDDYEALLDSVLSTGTWGSNRGLIESILRPDSSSGR